MTEYKYTVLFEWAKDEAYKNGAYNVRVPAMPEICTFGETLEEARTMAEDAIRLVIESNTKRGEPIPEDVIPDQQAINGEVVEEVEVKLTA